MLSVQLEMSTQEAPPPSFPSANQRLHSTAEVTWKTFKECVKGEVKYVCEDYKTMQDMNEHVGEKLRNTSDSFNKIGSQMQTLNRKSEEIEAYLKEVDTICEKIDKLDHLATGLDTYTRTLEARYKSLLKQS